MNRIAVVEDSATNRMLVRLLLQEHYEVVEYENGQAALNGFKTNKPDLVLLDLTLPDMDGSDVLEQIRADDELRDLPVVAFTASTTEDLASCLSVGFDDYVSKPIRDHEAFSALIRRALKRSESE